jgi:hypothetical protein
MSERDFRARARARPEAPIESISENLLTQPALTPALARALK